MFGSIGYILGRDIYKRLIQPFLCYKIVVYDMDDEYTFYEKKKHAQIRGNIKGFTLFKKKGKKNSGEFYTLPLDEAFGDVNDKYSKRDDRGFITYYFSRNNLSPLNIGAGGKIHTVINDARATNQILETNIFDSSINMQEDDKGGINWKLIGVIAIIIILVVMFQDKIAGLIG